MLCFPLVLYIILAGHLYSIVHRDLKLENLLLDVGRNVKIADFGLANTMRDGEFLRTSCGSPNYAAPEIVSGRLYAGPEIDVWSCGVILYVLLCGYLPFDNDSIVELFALIKSGNYWLPPSLPPPARHLISRMLTVDPMKRISVPDVRRHIWFQEGLPHYLGHAPDRADYMEQVVDEDTVDNIMALAGRGFASMDASMEEQANLVAKVNARLGPAGLRRRNIVAAIRAPSHRRRVRGIDETIRVSYELILDHKRTLLHAAKVPPMYITSSHSLTKASKRKFDGTRSDTLPDNRGWQHGENCATASRAAIPRHDACETPVLARDFENTKGTSVAWSLLRGPEGNVYVPARVPVAPSIDGIRQRKATFRPVTSTPTQPAESMQPRDKFTRAPRRSWFPGVLSRDDRAHVMTRVYLVLLRLGCEWHTVELYRLRVRWNPVNQQPPEQPQPSFAQQRNSRDFTVEMMLNLYQLQQGALILDFQVVNGLCLDFMTLCGRVIKQLNAC